MVIRNNRSKMLTCGMSGDMAVTVGKLLTYQNIIEPVIYQSTHTGAIIVQ